MTKHVWRIAANTRDYTADDATGKGAEITGGRWNRKGLPMLYASSSIALACLETTVHNATADLPLNRYLVRVELPDKLWNDGLSLDHTTAPVGWDAHPPGKVSLDYGDAWLKSAAGAVMFVPSVIVPEEYNVLINPRHSQASRIRYVPVRKWIYDFRL